MSCPSCAQLVAEESRFCSNCGHLLVRTEERRIVTVLFADLVGFTSLSEELDPEQLKHLIDRCFQRLVADITAFGGTVDKIVGDAIVALFGAPKAHEDDPERGVRAALRMQRTLGSIAEEMGSDLKMRIGVNTGEVLVGALQAGGDYTAMGDTVNVASRLQHLSRPGEVLVGQITRDATMDVVEYHSHGDVQLRGRDEMVHVYQAITETAPPGRRPRRERAPLVGREAEHIQLMAGIETSVARSRAHLINILGEAGMGKTRLAEEVAEVAEVQHDALVLEGRVVPYGETNPVRSIGEAISDLCELSTADSADIAYRKVSELVARMLEIGAASADVERVTEALLHVIGRPTPLRSLEQTRRTSEVLEGLRRFFDAAASRQPVVLILGDVHWADPRLLALVEHLLAALASRPFIVIASARWTVDEERWVVSPGRHNTMVLNLDPLDRDASRELIAELIGADVPDSVAEQLHDRSGGNPFYLEEIANLLREAGVVGPGTRGDFDVRGVAELPSTLRGLVAARLDSLSSDERSMVDNAAVFGREGYLYGLLLASRIPDQDQSVFRHLVDKDIFTIESERWAFRSDLLRDVAYSMLTKTDRGAKHVAIADWLAEHADDPTGETVGMIAEHYASAAELLPDLGPLNSLPSDLVDRAVDWLERAGLQADDRDSHYVAAQMFHRALSLVPEGDRRQLTAAIGRGRARLSLRELPGATADAELAMEIAGRPEVDDSRSLAIAIRLTGEIHSAAGDLTRAVLPLADALGRFEALGDDAEVAETLRLRGMVSLFAGEHEAADRDLDHARTIFEELGDAAGVGWCLQNLAWLSFEAGYVDEATERVTRAMELFADVDDEAGLSFARGLMAFIHFHEGRGDEAEALASEVLADAHQRGERFSEAMMDLLLASVSLWSGRARKAIEMATVAKSVFQQIDSEYGEVQAMGLLGRAFAAIGDIQSSRKNLDDCLSRADATSTTDQQRTFVRLVNAGAAVQIGDPVSALDHLEHLGERDDRRRMIGSVDVEVTRGLALLQLGDVAGALDVLLGVELGDLGVRAYLDSVLSLAFACNNDIAEAIAHSDSVLSEGRSTYLDRRTAGLARALSYARSGNRAAMEQAFRDALMGVDATESVMSQAVVRLARAVAYETMGDVNADAYRLEASSLLADMGVEVPGWERAFRIASGDIRSANIST
ncbi:MAG: class 3 adenylate cyclase/tetratricopeptide (TPR) repeat protein [Candidatus Poriferisodalaceae bacterium]|jgi:class 3 adenylate cyclase/tetratricopeptide (TPR) repeat protein